jgi:hypothetical protein
MLSLAVPLLARTRYLAALVSSIVTVPKIRLVEDSFTSELDKAGPLIFNKWGAWDVEVVLTGF